MGVPDNSFLDLIEKIRSWGSWSRAELSSFSTAELAMAMISCSGCEMKFSELCHKYCCQGCRRLLCGSCVRTGGSIVIIATSNGCKDVDHIEKVIKACKFCSKSSKRHIEKVYPSESPRTSPEPRSPLGCEKIWGHEDAKMVDEDCVPSCCEFRDHSFSPQKMGRGRLKYFDGHPSQTFLHHSPIQSDEEPEESGRHYFSASGDYYHDSSDIDTGSVSFRHESYSFRSAGSSPLDSPSRFNINTPRAGLAVQQPRGGSPKPQNSSPPNQGRMAILRRPDRGTGNLEDTDSQSDEMTIIAHQDEKFIKPLDFENNEHIWFPPPPEDEDDEAESNYVRYEEDDDDDDVHANVGHSSGAFYSCSSPSNLFSTKEKQSDEQREPLKTMIQAHFRALVSQLLQGGGIKFGIDDGIQDWLNIVSTLAWQAASFVKPDTSKGGSMDPGDYVKIKCVASGSPNESTLIKGVVCTKNIKHKRMTSQYKNPRLLLLGGSLEYQRAQNQLASFNTLLEEEMNHLKMVVSKIEAHRPNVLLVEKSVSSYAQEYLLAKEISLVLNVKRPLLERIARCTGALIIPSVDKISLARVGHCELFRLERVSEELETANQYNRRPSKTLMYFEGCPRRLGCTVLLKGLCREELKKIKHVVQFAVFAAYHLSLETSFLADEGAHLPKMTLKPSSSVSDSLADATSACIPDTVTPSEDVVDVVGPAEGVIVSMDDVEWEPASEQLSVSEALPVDATADNILSHVCSHGSICNAASEPTSSVPDSSSFECPSVVNPVQSELLESVFPVKEEPREMDKIDENGVASEYFAAAESERSILVSFSSHCVSKGALCERSRLLRIRFYGSFDKPLGKYLHDDLFDQASLCRSCKEPMEEHVQCYTHRQGSLTINVRRLDKVKLPGERDGKIWMWHRCLRCAQKDGVPPATQRVIMSDAAWGLSFGKFLELSFSNHATANRLAGCGHSLQRDCLRFYGFGSMVAFFHYSPIDILTVHLPPSVLEFNSHSKEDWIKREVEELKGKVGSLYAEIGDVLCRMEQKSASLGDGSLDPSDLRRHILELKDLLEKERDDYYGLLELASEESLQSVERSFDILDLNRVRRSLLIGSRTWDRRLYSLDSLLNSKSFTFDTSEDTGSPAALKELKNDPIKDSNFGIDQDENAYFTDLHISEESYTDSCRFSQPEVHGDGEMIVSEKSSESAQSPASNLSDKIDSAWTGTDVEAPQPGPVSQVNQVDNLTLRRLIAPTRMYSFDSAMRMHEKLHRGLAPSHLSAVRSFHASGDYRNMIRYPTPNVVRTYSQISPSDANFTHLCISSASHLGEGPRLLLPQTGLSDLVIAVYDDEPTSVISYALSSKEYDDWVSDKLNQHDGNWVGKDVNREDPTASTFLTWQSLGSLDLDYINYGSYGSEDSTSRSILFSDAKKSPHLHISFDDDSSCAGGKAKFSVTCYFAKQFDMLLKKCCPSKVDFVCSLSRCRRWSAQGGKSNVYFAKSMDERFIIKQVTKTELESFLEFAPQYFKYLNDSLDSGSPTCLAKIFGIFQVTVKGTRETKMDLMVMENLFFRRRISRVYDLKGSLRSRYNPDTTGANKVLLDMNLLETLRTSPIFLGSKAKRRLERAVWNDTSFLASVYVMDYSLLVGVDEERKELVLGIIDFMRQYTWDKHLETWVKASGILGGPKNASPTIISPKQYKKRFRKAMTTYFLTVPDQWSS